MNQKSEVEKKMIEVALELVQNQPKVFIIPKTPDECRDEQDMEDFMEIWKPNPNQEEQR